MEERVFPREPPVTRNPTISLARTFRATTAALLSPPQPHPPSSGRTADVVEGVCGGPSVLRSILSRQEGRNGEEKNENKGTTRDRRRREAGDDERPETTRDRGQASSEHEDGSTQQDESTGENERHRRVSKPRSVTRIVAQESIETREQRTWWCDRMQATG